MDPSRKILRFESLKASRGKIAAMRTSTSFGLIPVPVHTEAEDDSATVSDTEESGNSWLGLSRELATMLGRPNAKDNILTWLDCAAQQCRLVRLQQQSSSSSRHLYSICSPSRFAKPVVERVISVLREAITYFTARDANFPQKTHVIYLLYRDIIVLTEATENEDKVQDVIGEASSKCPNYWCLLHTIRRFEVERFSENNLDRIKHRLSAMRMNFEKTCKNDIAAQEMMGAVRYDGNATFHIFTVIMTQI
jgi:hypothetical protein